MVIRGIMKLVWSSYIPTAFPIITFTDIVVSNIFIIRQQILIFEYLKPAIYSGFLSFA